MPSQLIGINHVALEVDSIDEALEFYGRFFELHLRGVVPGMAFIDMGDQFLALSEGPRAGPRPRPPLRARRRRQGGACARRSRRPGSTSTAPPRLDFHDPWGNRVEIVDYRDIQFTKAPPVLAGMGLDDLEKRPAALEQLRDKGLLGM